jgi:transcriptional regulator with XRE-family HTH domain
VSDLHATARRKEMALRIASLRQSRHISKAAFAKLIGVSRPTMYDIEGGNRRIFADELLIISRSLGVSLEWLFGSVLTDATGAGLQTDNAVR